MEKIREKLKDTVIILVEEIPKDGVENIINVVYPPEINEMIEDYYSFKDLLSEEYTLKLIYVINTFQHLEIYEKAA